MGRSSGAGALSVWTHYLKGLEFLPEFSIGEYKGMAVRMGAGVEAWELFNFMAAHNFSTPQASWDTVGASGGWVLGGGHSIIASHHGLGSDQILSMEVVTADGRLVTADPFTNKELFYALRGGGPGMLLAWITVLLEKKKKYVKIR
jgi:FAD/FMN-containing dehydrogenase